MYQLGLKLNQDLSEGQIDQMTLWEFPEESSVERPYVLSMSEQAADSAYLWTEATALHNSSARRPEKRLHFELRLPLVPPAPTPTTPQLSVAGATVTEGDSGSSDLTFNVTLNPIADAQVTVDYATADDTATAGTDYTAQTGQLTFAVGETVKTITVAVTGDTLVEEYETFTVTLSNPVGAELGRATAAGYIIDNVAGDETGSGITLSVSNVQQYSASISFTNYLPGADLGIGLWETNSRTTGICLLYNDTTSDGTTDSFTLTGLNRGTDYTVSVNVGADCAAELSAATFMTPDARPPTARVGVVDENGAVTSQENVTVVEGDTVTLDASLSSDPTYVTGPLLYEWSASLEILLSTTDEVRTSFTAPQVSQQSNFSVLADRGGPGRRLRLHYLDGHGVGYRRAPAELLGRHANGGHDHALQLRHRRLVVPAGRRGVPDGLLSIGQSHRSHGRHGV